MRALGSDIPFYCLQSIGLASTNFHDSTIEAMVSRYVKAIREFQPNGPDQIGGYCFGDVVPFEMACQLERMGELVELAAIFEGFAPHYVRNNFSLSLIPARVRSIVKNFPFWLEDYSRLGSLELLRRIRSTIGHLPLPLTHR